MHGQDHPKVASMRTKLAHVFVGQERANEAELLYRRTLTTEEAFYGSDHPNVARTLNDLAIPLICEAKIDEAEIIYRRVLAIEEVVHGPEHLKVAARNLQQLVLLYGNKELTMSGLNRLGGGLYGPPIRIINLMCAVCALSHFLSLRSSDPAQFNLNQPTLDQLQGDMFASPCS